MFDFAKLYLAPFNDNQVDEFLRRRYGFFYTWPKDMEESLKAKGARVFRRWRFLWRKRQREKARLVVSRIPLLSIRPLLLAYIPDVLEKAAQIQYSYQLYQLIVDYWYDVEADWWAGKDHIRVFSDEIAVQMYRSFLETRADRMQREQVAQVARKMAVPVDDWKTTARSLLNRDAHGNYKFAHRSIMEYIFVKKFVEGDPRCRGIRWTDQMKKFMLEMIVAKHGFKLGSREYSGADLEDADLGWSTFKVSSPLRGISLPRSNLRKVKFPRWGDLQGANFRESNLEMAYIYSAILTEADLSKANLHKANLLHCNLTKANLESSNLEDADLQWAVLMQARAKGANFQRCNLRGARCREINLENADLRDAILGCWESDNGADLQRAILRYADFTNAVLAGVNLRGADLSGSVITWEQLMSAHTDAHTIVDPIFEARLKLLPSRHYQREVRKALHAISNSRRSPNDLIIGYSETGRPQLRLEVSGAGGWRIGKEINESWEWTKGSLDASHVKQVIGIIIRLLPWEYEGRESESSATLTISVGNLEGLFANKNIPALTYIRDLILEILQPSAGPSPRWSRENRP